MPFGARVQADGTVCFRLWAPAAVRVTLRLEGPGEPARFAMARQADGWYECVTREAGPGSLYRYEIDGGIAVPDPASRHQPRDVHGPSEVVDPAACAWHDEGWFGRPWEEAVFYELHVGTFTEAGTFQAVIERLDHLVRLGVTAVELMPVADFSGRRNWGYDGVLLFAPDATYGRPEDLKALVQAAHGRGLMVFLDVVYNHFGPDGNYLHRYAPGFFTDRHHTPWGAGINFDGPGSRVVRDFFIHNALYWLTEYRFDGLRLDAVQAIADDSDPDILIELAEAVAAGPGRERRIHLVLEHDDNAARYLARRPDGRPRWYRAQWNDDFHHAAHLLLTDEADGYYADYAEAPLRHLGRCLAEGFAYQGEPSAFRGRRARGEPSADLPPTAFVNLLQNHDQAGNRALGERLDALAAPQPLRALLTILLLAPSPPLLFMGQEMAAAPPFLFFCDFGDDLAAAVTEGRRREFAAFARFADPQAREAIPDPNAEATFARCKLDWRALAGEPDWFGLHRDLLAVRHAEIVPRLPGTPGGCGEYALFGPPAARHGLRVRWRLGDGSRLILTANLGGAELSAPADAVDARLVHAEPSPAAAMLASGRFSPWSVVWQLAGEATAWVTYTGA
nr:malto-oligosyltrehalose trehalohydrolase [Thioflavicoccus mobilis]